MEDSFEWNLGNELFDLDHATTVQVKEKKTTTVKEFLEHLSEYFKHPVNRIRLWPLRNRKNNVQRPTFCDIDSLQNDEIHELFDSPSNVIFLELKNAQLPEFRHTEDLLLFFKYYDPQTSQIHYCGYYYFPMNATFYDIAVYLNKLLGFPECTKLIFYEEQKNGFRLHSMADCLQNVSEI